MKHMGRYCMTERQKAGYCIIGLLELNKRQSRIMEAVELGVRTQLYTDPYGAEKEKPWT
jgi:hypothetical protein